MNKRESESALEKVPKGKIWKTNGNSELILVDDPDIYNSDETSPYRIKKYRNPMKHLTPKKKKRK